MYKFLYFVFCIFLINSFVLASTAKKIEEQNQNIQKNKTLEKTLKTELKDIGNEILKKQAELDKIQEKIAELFKTIELTSDQTKDIGKNLDFLLNENLKLIEQKKEIEQRMIKAIAEDFSLFILMQELNNQSFESMVANEALSKMNEILNKEIQELVNMFSQTNTKIHEHSLQISDLEKKLKTLKKQRDEFSILEKKKTELLGKLESKKESYKNKIGDIEKERVALNSTLKSLKILLDQEESKRKEDLKTKQEASANVRQVGSSYQQSRIKKYSGPKTISPLENFTVEQKFGDYVDPIYKIKIFNESVILRSKKPDAEVRSVLGGKVIFAKETMILGNVVIIENNDGIHTVYAYMSKIAPTINVGTKVKKGYVIGRVESDLVFEVTQKNYHIDPLELITL